MRHHEWAIESAPGRLSFTSQRAGAAFALVIALFINHGQAAAICAGDCDRLDGVTVDELVALANVALGTLPLSTCPIGDVDANGSVTVDELIAAVSFALDGCPSATCADKVVEADEECDDGGICTGGPLAGTACTSESECLAGGACFGGLDDLRACESDDDCSIGDCRRCRPVGGDGCAANCTIETEVSIDLVPGVRGRSPTQNNDLEIEFGTSGIGHFGPFSYDAGPIDGRIVLTTGKLVDGVMPLVVRANDLPIAEFLSYPCGCFRLPEASTCGGTVFELEGTPSLDCTAGFDGTTACPPNKPCAPVHGAGNGGSGVLGCGMDEIGVNVAQDCNEPFPPMTTTDRTFAGETNAAQALVMLSPAIARRFDFCVNGPMHGADGKFCTADDPVTDRGTLAPFLFTTGMATGTIVEGLRGGPHVVQGSPFECRPDGSLDIRSGGIVATSTTCSRLSFEVMPVVLFFGPPRPTRTPTFTPTDTPGARDCCQCDEPLVCRAPVAGSCGECIPVYRASCDSAGASCQTPTRPPTRTPTPIPPTQTRRSTPTITATRANTLTPTETNTPSQSWTPTATRLSTQTRIPTATGTPVPVRIVVGQALFGDAGSTAILEVTLLDQGVVEVQNHIVFDNRVMTPTAAGCVINPAIGRSPNGPQPALNCGDDFSIAPCKMLSTLLSRCDSSPPPAGCPEGAGGDTSVLALTITSAGSNVDEIPVGVLYTCELQLIDPSRLPTVLANPRVLASNVPGDLIPAVGIDGLATGLLGRQPDMQFTYFVEPSVSYSCAQDLREDSRLIVCVGNQGLASAPSFDVVVVSAHLQWQVEPLDVGQEACFSAPLRTSAPVQIDPSDAVVESDETNNTRWVIFPTITRGPGCTPTPTPSSPTRTPTETPLVAATPTPTIEGGCIAGLDPDRPREGCTTAVHHCLPPYPGERCFDVIAGDGCCWSASLQPPAFLSVVSGSAGCGRDQICYAYGNPGIEERNAIVLVGDREFTIQQRRRYTITATKTTTKTPTRTPTGPGVI